MQMQGEISHIAHNKRKKQENEDRKKEGKPEKNLEEALANI